MVCLHRVCCRDGSFLQANSLDTLAAVHVNAVTLRKDSGASKTKQATERKFKNMARRQKEENDTQKLLDTAKTQIAKLWEKGENKFMAALEDSGKNRVTVNFGVTLDLSESAPVVDTQMSFRDKAKESGMDVTKSFRLSHTDQLEDPNAPALPGLERERDNGAPEEEAPKRRGRKKQQEEPGQEAA